MTSIIWGLLGAIFIGVSDGIGRVTTQRVSLNILILFIMGISTFLMSIWFLLTWDWPEWHFYSWLVSFLSGFLNVIALLFLFQALARGPVYVASPAASSFSVILVTLNVLSGQPINSTQIIAIIVVFFSIIMLTRPSKGLQLPALEYYSTKWLRVTALLGVGTGITVAVRFFLAQEAVLILKPTHALYLNRFSALIFVIILLCWEFYRKHNMQWPKHSTLFLIVTQSILEMLSLGAFLFGSTTGGRVGVAIGFSAFAAITTLTSWIWLGEKVSLQKMFWIGIIAISIVASLIFSP